jgi:hypothetical protein
MYITMWKPPGISIDSLLFTIDAWGFPHDCTHNGNKSLNILSPLFV